MGWINYITRIEQNLQNESLHAARSCFQRYRPATKGSIAGLSGYCRLVENNCFYSVSGIYLSDGLCICKINCKQAQGRQFSNTV